MLLRDGTGRERMQRGTNWKEREWIDGCGWKCLIGLNVSLLNGQSFKKTPGRDSGKWKQSQRSGGNEKTLTVGAQFKVR